MGKRSAGILLFRRTDAGVDVLLGHLGGPLSAAWSIPKGEYGPDEEPIRAARREFTEELGLPVPDGHLLELGDIRQPSGKVVTAWAIEADLDPGLARYGTFMMEWPRGSGRLREFPELDRAEWFGLEQSREKIILAQRAFLDRLAELLRNQS
jgi:predicted NUDIX family NTP pyrophosphohydrolase